MQRSLARLLAAAALCALAAAAPAGAATTRTVRQELSGLIDRTAAQWAGLLTPVGVFANPFSADVARGHAGFAPPGLMYALHRAGQRTRNAALVAAAERAWPNAVDPVRASSFDMLAAAHALRDLDLSEGRRAQLTSYVSRYGIPPTGAACITRRDCYNNLKLADAVAVLAITGTGVQAADPAARLGNRLAARAVARRLVNRRLARVVDHGVRARVGDAPVAGTILSDPPSNPLAYHALSAFFVAEAVEELGPAASRAARRIRREALDALLVLLAPDGDVSYLGRGQGQVWVPAVAAAALAAGARDAAVHAPRRAGRYLAAARRAVHRVERRHATASQGLDVVPGARARITAEGIDVYAHTVAYNALAMLGLTLAQRALDATPQLRVGRLPGAHRLTVADPGGSGVGVAGDGRVWLAVHANPVNRADLRHDFGALALKRRTPEGWTDLLAPRPLTATGTDSTGPALLRRGRAITPTGTALQARGRTIAVRGGYRVGERWIRRVRFRWRLTAAGVVLTLRGARRGDRFRVLAFTPAGTGAWAHRELLAAGARWRFDRPILGRRLPGFHSGPVEQLDALEAQVAAPRSGRLRIRIAGPVAPGAEPRPIAGRRSRCGPCRAARERAKSAREPPEA